IQTGSQLWNLFALMLEHCVPAHPEVLWEQYKASICNNLRVALEHRFQQVASTQGIVYDYEL
ncbi:hypothetical protein BC834DRAFT_804311, partial [Gloeopeniophorella convolvens]